jgi:GNAT superfamily N-acetyltransferase
LADRLVRIALRGCVAAGSLTGVPEIWIEQRHDPAAVDSILRQLPEWFGIEDAIRSYVTDASTMPSFLATSDGQVVGVALVRRHFDASAELHLIAVDQNYHGQGVGSMLVAAIEDDLRADGVRMLQVHTVGPSYENAPYAQTRAFYEALGFVPLQVFEGVDWEGPTLILAKSLR